MAEFMDLTGHRYGLWTVIKRASRRRHWLCRCDCGTVKSVDGHNMRSGASTNCGCRKAQISRALFTTHGATKTPLYKCWRNMHSRCSNPNMIEFPRYGGRGIVVCDEWKRFEPFQEWAKASGFQPGLTIDRIDNDKGYEPANCRWTDRATQCLNRECVIRLPDGRAAIEVAREHGAQRCYVARIHLGWDIERACTTPVRSIRR